MIYLTGVFLDTVYDFGFEKFRYFCGYDEMYEAEKEELGCQISPEQVLLGEVEAGKLVLWLGEIKFYLGVQVVLGEMICISAADLGRRSAKRLCAAISQILLKRLLEMNSETQFFFRM